MAAYPRPEPPLRPDSDLGRSRLGAFAALSVRAYRVYWFGQLISVSGVWMQQVSLPWLVLALGGTPLQLGVAATLQFAPPFFFAPLGGVLADRVDKRRVLVLSHSMGMIQAAVLFFVTVTDVVTIPIVMVMALWLGLVNAVEMPFRHAFVAELVPRNLLPNAIAISAMAFNVGRVLGPATAGAVIAAGSVTASTPAAGVAPNFAINAVAYLAILTALVRISPRQPKRPEPGIAGTSLASSLREGVSYAWHTPIVLWPLALLGGIAAFGFNFQVLLPIFTRDVLGIGAGGYGALFASIGIGSVCGSITLALLSGRRAIPAMVASSFLFGGCLIGFGSSTTLAVAIPIAFLLGYFWMLVVNSVNAVIQASIPDLLRGRVMSLYVTVFVGAVPIGSLLSSAMAEAWGAPMAFIASAVAFLAVATLVCWNLRLALGR